MLTSRSSPAKPEIPGGKRSTEFRKNKAPTTFILASLFFFFFLYKCLIKDGFDGVWLFSLSPFSYGSALFCLTLFTPEKLKGKKTQPEVGRESMLNQNQKLT